MCLFVPSAISWTKQEDAWRDDLLLAEEPFKDTSRIPETRAWQCLSTDKLTLYLSARSLSAGDWQMLCPVRFQDSRISRKAGNSQLLDNNQDVNTHVVTISDRQNRSSEPLE